MDKSLPKKLTHSFNVYLLLLLCIAISGICSASFEGIPGDINRDGSIDILDIQQGINMVIGAETGIGLADTNSDASIDILDIQILVNTVLGVGGLVQSIDISLGDIQSLLSSYASLDIMAFSDDGRQVIAPVLSNAGSSVRMLLPVGCSWVLGVVGKLKEGQYRSVPIQFRLLDKFTSGIPLHRISIGKILDLGTLNLTQDVVVLDDLRLLLAKISESLPAEDANDNQIPDFHETFLQEFEKLIGSINYLETLGLTQSIIEQINRNLNVCIQPRQDELLTPTLYRTEDTGYPLPLLPLIDCVKEIIRQYIAQSGLPNANYIFNTVWSLLDGQLRQVTADWLRNMTIIDMMDLNTNFIADWLEEYLCLQENCIFDQNGNVIPEVFEDTDGDGIPNFLDEDFRSESDLDGDDIPNELDWDANGNGILDYAETQ